MLEGTVGKEKRWLQLTDSIPLQTEQGPKQFQGLSCHLESLPHSMAKPDTEWGPHVTHPLSILTCKEALEFMFWSQKDPVASLLPMDFT